MHSNSLSQQKGHVRGTRCWHWHQLCWQWTECGWLTRHPRLLRSTPPTLKAHLSTTQIHLCLFSLRNCCCVAATCTFSSKYFMNFNPQNSHKPKNQVHLAALWNPWHRGMEKSHHLPKVTWLVGRAEAWLEPSYSGPRPFTSNPTINSSSPTALIIWCGSGFLQFGLVSSTLHKKDTSKKLGLQLPFK